MEGRHRRVRVKLVPLLLAMGGVIDRINQDQMLAGSRAHEPDLPRLAPEQEKGCGQAIEAAARGPLEPGREAQALGDTHKARRVGAAFRHGRSPAPPSTPPT